MELNNPIKNVRLSFACDKNFDAMTPCSTGRHCDACNKVVIDFTNKTMADYEAAFEATTEICGRFEVSQLAVVQIPNTWMSRIAATVALIVGLGAFNTELSAQKATSRPSQGQKVVYPVKMHGIAIAPSSNLPFAMKNELLEAFKKELPVFSDSLSGTMSFGFSLDEAGNLTNLTIRKSLDPAFDQAVLQLLAKLNFISVKKDENTYPAKTYFHKLIVMNGVIAK